MNFTFEMAMKEINNSHGLRQDDAYIFHKGTINAWKIAEVFDSRNF